MKVIDGVHVLTLEEWKNTPAVKEREAEFEDCPECNGDGTHECECGNVHDCHECDGEGKTSTLDKVYQSELRAELQKLVLWRDGLAKKVAPLPKRLTNETL